MKHEFNLVPPVMHLMLRFTQALITQMAQTAVCNRGSSSMRAAASGYWIAQAGNDGRANAIGWFGMSIGGCFRTAR